MTRAQGSSKTLIDFFVTRPVARVRVRVRARVRVRVSVRARVRVSIRGRPRHL